MRVGRQPNCITEPQRTGLERVADCAPSFRLGAPRDPLFPPNRCAAGVPAVGPPAVRQSRSPVGRKRISIPAKKFESLMAAAGVDFQFALPSRVNFAELEKTEGSTAGSDRPASVEPDWPIAQVPVRHVVALVPQHRDLL